MKKWIGRVTILILVAITLVALVFAVYSCSRPSPFWRARKQIHVGMNREEAIKVLAPISWYHQPCPAKSEVITDLFFYGSRQYDTDDILIVTSRAADGVFIVENIGSFEPNAWHTAYRNCIQRDKFID